MTKKRIATMATCIALVGAVAVGGTLALLSSQTKELTNTFTVGDNYLANDFILKEYKVTQQGNGDYANTSSETTSDVSYDNVVADSDLDKSPWFELVDSNSEDGKTPPRSWIVAKVNNIEALTTAKLNITNVDEGWRLVTATKAGDAWTYQLDSDALAAADFKADTAETKYYFVYMTQLTAGGKTNPLFTKLHAADIADTLNTSVDVKGVAVQAVTADSNLTQQDVLNDVMAAAASKLG